MLLVDKFSGKPVYEQLIEEIERGVLLGVYPEGAQLPSIRELSAALSINPNTIQKSYTELSHRGIIVSSPGNGCFVSPKAREVLRRNALNKMEQLTQLAHQLRLAGVSEQELIAAVSGSKEETK